MPSRCWILFKVAIVADWGKRSKRRGGWKRTVFAGKNLALIGGKRKQIDEWRYCHLNNGKIYFLRSASQILSQRWTPRAYTDDYFVTLWSLVLHWNNLFRQKEICFLSRYTTKYRAILNAQINLVLLRLTILVFHTLFFLLLCNDRTTCKFNVTYQEEISGQGLQSS